MKRLPLLFLLTLMLAGGLHAQPIDREMFAKVVGMNSKRNCPMRGDGVTIEKLTYSPGVLHFHITADEDVLMGMSATEVEKYSREYFPEKSGPVMMERMHFDGESLHLYCNIDSMSISKLDTSALRTILRNQIASTRGRENFYDPLTSLNGGVLFHYKILETDSTLETYFSPAEVREIMSMENYSEKRQAQIELENLVVSTNLQCPYQLDGSMWLDSTGIDNGRFIYYYTITAYAPNISPNILHDWMRTQLAESEDESVKYIIQLCVKTGTALSYRYFHPKQEEPSRKKKKAEKPQKPALEIWFTVDELKDMLH